MRVVLDTNVVVSALLWGGVPEQILQLAREGEPELVSSPALVAELSGILNRPKFAAKLTQKNSSPSEVVALTRSSPKRSRQAPLNRLRCVIPTMRRCSPVHWQHEPI